MTKVYHFRSFCLLLTSLFILSVLAGCRKRMQQDESRLMADRPGSTSTSTTTPSLLHLSPQPKDTSVDVGSSVVITCNATLNAHKLQTELFQVYREKNDIVVGEFIYKETSAEFRPSVEFMPSTTYTVRFEGSVTIRTDNASGDRIEKVSLSWKFTTDSITEYIMTRTNAEVTAFARDGCKMIQFGDYLYLYGGWRGNETGSSSHNDIYRSSGDLSVWERMPDAEWTGRHTFGLGILNNQLYVYGGDQNTEYFDVWKSDDGLNFTQVHQDLDYAVKSRLIYGTTTHQNKLYIIGGQVSLEPSSGLGDVWASPNGYAWRRFAGAQDFLGKNLAGAVASFMDKLWVIGGGEYGHPDSSERWTNHIYSSLDGRSWTREPDAPWSGRQFADVCVWDNKLWIIGGHNGKNLSEIWYMMKNGSWHQYQPSNLFVPRHASAVATYNDKLVIVCGDQNNECWVIEKAP